MSQPRQFVYSDRHSPTYISHPVTLGRKYGFVIISDLHFFLFLKYSVDSLIPTLNGSVLISSLYTIVFNNTTGNKMGCCAQNIHNFDVTVILSRIIALIEAI